MKRFCAAAVLLLLGSPSYAGESYSFVVGGHHIHIETSRHCRSTSCVSVSIPDVYEKRARRDRYDGDRYDDKAGDATPRAPVTLPPAPIASQRPVSTPAAPAVCAPATPAVPVQPQIQPAPVQPLTTAAVVPAPAVALPSPPPPPPPPPPAAIDPPADAALPMAPAIAPSPRVNKVVHKVEKEPDGPLGDWVTEGNKGTVRIEPCGQALCGYVLDPATEAKGEAVLIDMKAKEKSEWSGNIYSRDSGDTYYATLTLKDPNTIEVRACALWRFWCSGNAWSRIAMPKRLVSYRQL